MGIMSFLSGGIINQVTKGVKDVSEIFVENSEAAGQRAHEAQLSDAALVSSAQQMAAREFHTPRNWFDSLINGINRLPRPFLALGTLGLFTYAFLDPPGFAIVMAAMEGIPLEMWGLLSAIICFYFGSRGFQKHKESNISLKRVEAILQHQRELEGLRRESPVVLQEEFSAPPIENSWKAKALNLIKEFEGFEEVPYKDAIGKITIGYGRTTDFNDKPLTMDAPLTTREQEENWLLHRIEKDNLLLSSWLNVPITDNQRAAYISLLYNVGPKIKNWKVIKRMNEGKPKEAAENFLNINKAAGRVLPGLTRRRKAEYDLFMMA